MYSDNLLSALCRMMNAAAGPFFTGSICAVCIVFALRSALTTRPIQRNGTTRQPFCGYGCISSYGVRLQSAYRLFSSPRQCHFEYWFARSLYCSCALISKLPFENRSCCICHGYGSYADYDGCFSAGLPIHPIQHPMQKSWSNRPDTDLYRFKMEFSGTAFLDYAAGRLYSASAAPCPRRKTHSGITASVHTKTAKNTA